MISNEYDFTVIWFKQRLYKFLLLISPPCLAQPVLSTDGVVYFVHCSYAYEISQRITSHMVIYSCLFTQVQNSLSLC